MAASPRKELQLPTAIPVLQYTVSNRKFRTRSGIEGRAHAAGHLAVHTRRDIWPRPRAFAPSRLMAHGACERAAGARLTGDLHRR